MYKFGQCWGGMQKFAAWFTESSKDNPLDLVLTLKLSWLQSENCLFYACNKIKFTDKVKKLHKLRILADEASENHEFLTFCGRNLSCRFFILIDFEQNEHFCLCMLKQFSHPIKWVLSLTLCFWTWTVYHKY